MSTTFTLESPFVSYTSSGVPKHWKAILAAWLLFWAGVSIGLIYLYAVVLPDMVGFETALLVGIALIALGIGGSDD